MAWYFEKDVSPGLCSPDERSLFSVLVPEPWRLCRLGRMMVSPVLTDLFVFFDEMQDRFLRCGSPSLDFIDSLLRSINHIA